jgi:hypothetical protein
MEKNESERYELLTKLRTWSEYHSERGTEVEGPPSSPKLAAYRWGGCSQGCQHHNLSFPKRVKRGSVIDRENLKREHMLIQQKALKVQEEVIHSPVHATIEEEDQNDDSDHPTGGDYKSSVEFASPTRTMSLKKLTSSTMLHPYELHNRPSFASRARTFSGTSSSSHLTGQSLSHSHLHHHQYHYGHPSEHGEHPLDEEELNSADEEDEDGNVDDDEDSDAVGLSLPSPSYPRTIPKLGLPWSHTQQYYLAAGRDGGGSKSGIGSPAESDTDGDQKPPASLKVADATVGGQLTAEPSALPFKHLSDGPRRSSSPLRSKAIVTATGQHPLRKVSSTEEEPDVARSESIDAKAGGDDAVSAKEDAYVFQLEEGEGTAVGDIY